MPCFRSGKAHGGGTATENCVLGRCDFLLGMMSGASGSVGCTTDASTNSVTTIGFASDATWRGGELGGESCR
jgi:hypothetical protein